MAILTGTATTFSGSPGIAGIREDLTDKIWNISPMDTPFVSSIERVKVANTLHEWQTDSLASADTSNAQLQGDDIATFDAVVPTTRLGNRTQISRKTLIIDGTLEAVLKAGRKSEIAMQLAKKGKELKRDIEAILVGTNQAKATGSAAVVPKTASVLSWIKTNTDKDATLPGVDPAAADGTGTRTDGNTRSFLESQLKSVLKKIFDATSDAPDLVLLPSLMKQTASTFTGNQTKTQDTSDKKLIASIDYYTSDFGTVRLMPDRFMRSRDVLVLNTELWGLGWLRPIKMKELATTGDAEKRMLIGEYCLESRNEAGSGGVFDLA
jgi:hypothetical protein